MTGRKEDKSTIIIKRGGGIILLAVCVKLLLSGRGGWPHHGLLCHGGNYI